MGEQRLTSELRQVELVDAALHIIATRGITSLTTRSLAEHVGLTSGAIFRHFASLDALLDAVVGRVEVVLESTFPSPDLPPRERIVRFVEARSAAVGSQIGMLRLVLSEQFILALPKEGSARLSACVQKTREFLHTSIAEAQAAGEIRKDMDAHTLAVVVMGTIQMLALSNANPEARALEAQAVQDGLFTMLNPPTPTPAKRSKKSA